MAKNELLPFADGEDANVLPTNQWEALTDILENGFQSGIARSEQVNRVLAQGAVASYVLGQLIVDELNQDATLDKDTLYQRLVSALESKAKDVCLPLGGGKIMGAITNPADGAFSWTSGEYKCTMLLAGEWGSSAGLSLRSKDATSETGFFNLLAADSTQSKLLQGRPNGTLQWGGNNVITSAGGTVNNKITFTSQRAIDSTNQGGLFIVAEKDKDSRNTSSIAVFPVGYSEANRKGAFEIGCSDGTNQKKLIGHYSDGLKWDGHHVLQYLNPSLYADAPTDGTVYTIPWDCYGFFECTRDNSGSGTMWIKVNGHTVTDLVSDDYSNPKLSLPLKKGQTLQITSDGRLTGMWAKLVGIGG